MRLFYEKKKLKKKKKKEKCINVLVLMK